MVTPYHFGGSKTLLDSGSLGVSFNVTVVGEVCFLLEALFCLFISLGAFHDGDARPLTSRCDPNSYIMSPSVNGVTETTKDTYYTFSGCTSDQFLAYLSK